MSQTFRIILETPVINWSQVFSSLESGAALTLLFFALSYLALYALFRAAEGIENKEQLDMNFELLVLLGLLGFPAAFLGSNLIKALDASFVEKQRLENLKEKAEAYDEMFEVDN